MILKLKKKLKKMLSIVYCINCYGARCSKINFDTVDIRTCSYYHHVLIYHRFSFLYWVYSVASHRLLTNSYRSLIILLFFFFSILSFLVVYSDFIGILLFCKVETKPTCVCLYIFPIIKKIPTLPRPQHTPPSRRSFYLNLTANLSKLT